MDRYRLVTLPSFAKVNLTLDVRERLPNGYHLIQSVMQEINLADEVTVCLTDEEGIRLECPGATVPEDSSNLAWTAAERFHERLGTPPHLHITLHKRIPAQAGLGGGSSNAATVLRALNILYGYPFSPEQMRSIAISLGSDVPFFLQGGTALVEGLGDVITPLPVPLSYPLVIAVPSAGVSTAWAYEQIDRERILSGIEELPPPSTPAMVNALHRGANWPSLLHNDFETVVLPANLPIQQLKANMVLSGALAALLCGSGSAVMGVYSDEREAQRAALKLRRTGHRAWACTFNWR